VTGCALLLNPAKRGEGKLHTNILFPHARWARRRRPPHQTKSHLPSKRRSQLVTCNLIGTERGFSCASDTGGATFREPSVGLLLGDEYRLLNSTVVANGRAPTFSSLFAWAPRCQPQGGGRRRWWTQLRSEMSGMSSKQAGNAPRAVLLSCVAWG
jgi:hypothetical protein